jgi:hypothetical protein
VTAKHKGRKPSDIGFGVAAFVVLIGLPLLLIGLGVPLAAVEPAIFAAP